MDCQRSTRHRGGLDREARPVEKERQKNTPLQCNSFDLAGAAMDFMSMASFEEQLVVHQGYLLRFARLQLRNGACAEDAVSETLLAALSKSQSFGNRSQLKSWLVGILKHKVIDLIRINARTVSIPDNAIDDNADELNRLQSKVDGHFAQTPDDWGNPDQTLQQVQFFVVLDACVERLSPALGRLFLMREWLEMPCP